LRHTETRILPYRPDQLMAMVGDVQAYPQFIPWITHMRTWNARDGEEGISTLDAEAQVGFSFLRERFATRVRRDAPAGEITVQLLSGPFRRLFNRWRFKPHPEGTEVAFEIDFEFKSRLLENLLQANYRRAVARLIGCFEDRAAQIYGSKDGRD
jgi:coenzyme Q-binding protein COQ10